MLINNLFILLLVLFLFIFPVSALAQKEDLIQRVYAYYPLDANTNDQGPRQLDGDQVSKERSTEDRFGNENSALFFSKKDKALTLPVNINPEIMPQITIAFWLKIENQSGMSTVISNNDGNFDRSIIIDGRKKQTFLAVSAGENQEIYGGLNIPPNKWFFTAVSWNAENGEVSLYLIDQNKNFRMITTNNINPGRGEKFIKLGQNPDKEDFFEGAVDQLMIWDQILSRDQIKSLTL